jgi:hypothetical protein
MPPQPREFRAFTALTDRLLSVSKETIDKRMAAYKQQADQNPRKRGPKPKTTGGRASRDVGEGT